MQKPQKLSIWLITAYVQTNDKQMFEMYVLYVYTRQQHKAHSICSSKDKKPLIIITFYYGIGHLIYVQ